MVLFTGRTVHAISKVVSVFIVLLMHLHFFLLLFFSFLIDEAKCYAFTFNIY
jgi:hypothetical protein